jgi:hypothetical protein
LTRVWKSNNSIGIALLGICLSCASVAAASEPRVPAPEGTWDGSIQTSAGEVNFGIELRPQGNELGAVLVNGTDRQPFSSAAWNGAVLTLRLDYYDGLLTVQLVSPQKMEGEYSRQTSKGMVHIPITLVPHQNRAPGKAWKGLSLAGDWLFVRPVGHGEDKVTLATFQQELMAAVDGRVPITGILEPVSGDTGLLHGSVYADADGRTHFHLSRFDGIHVIALDGEFQPHGTLMGQIAGITSSAPFTAERGKDVASANPNAQAGSLTRVKDPQQAFRFGGVNLSGEVINHRAKSLIRGARSSRTKR